MRRTAKTDGEQPALRLDRQHNKDADRQKVKPRIVMVGWMKKAIKEATRATILESAAAKRTSPGQRLRNSGLTL